MKRSAILLSAAAALCGACGTRAAEEADASARDAAALVPSFDAAGSDGPPSDGSPPDAGRAGALRLPEVVDLPYAIAGGAGTSTVVTFENSGDRSIDGLSIVLTTSGAFSLSGVPDRIDGGGRAVFTVAWSGAPKETIDRATLVVAASGIGPTRIPVFAAAGAPDLPQAAWTEVHGAGGVLAGSGTTLALPAAPYPEAGKPYTDASVRIFVPEAYRDLGSHLFVLHFHGWSTTLAGTLSAHRYEEHVFASGANAVLVVPQGPVDAQSGDFGKLMRPEGTRALLEEVLIVLFRDGWTRRPELGGLALTSHSGGYQAVAANLGGRLPVRQVDLFDSLYGDAPVFESFAAAGSRFRSNYTMSGGTLAENQAVAMNLAGRGLAVASAPSHRALKSAAPVIAFAPTTHEGSTRIEGAYGEWLRWSAPNGRHGPKIEIRSAAARAGEAEIAWLSPASDDVTAFRVETSTDAVRWTVAAEIPPDGDRARFAFHGSARVRVRARVRGLDESRIVPSDELPVAEDAGRLVVDHFDRRIGGAFGGLSHDFAARIGESAGGASAIDHRAIEEDGFDLRPYQAVIWMLGDQSADDRTFTPGEEDAIRAYLAGGGRLIVSGSEVGFDLSARSLLGELGATYLADDSRSGLVQGSGQLAALREFGIGGAPAPYHGFGPDVLGAAAGAELVLVYGDGRGAAAGIAGRVVVVGFPLEAIDRPEDRTAVLRALLAFVGG